MIKNSDNMVQIDNNMTDANKFFAELSDHVVITSGYDKPRYAYLKDSKAGSSQSFVYSRVPPGGVSHPPGAPLIQ